MVMSACEANDFRAMAIDIIKVADKARSIGGDEYAIEELTHELIAHYKVTCDNTWGGEVGAIISAAASDARESAAAESLANMEQHVDSVMDDLQQKIELSIDLARVALGKELRRRRAEAGKKK